MQTRDSSKSSITLFNNCKFAYFLKYILNIPDKKSKSAIIGNIVHLVFHMMCQIKKKGLKQKDPFILLEKSWDFYANQYKDIDLRRINKRGESADYKKCKKSIKNILDDYQYNPYNLNILESEIRFKMQIPGEEWNIDNKQHRSVGVIDLVHEINKDTIEIVDWKTGQQKDFYTQKDITREELVNDVQVRLYHLAAHELFYQYKNIIITVYYINEGGPIQVPLSFEHLAPTLGSLNRHLNKVKDTEKITRNRTWKCKMCGFYKSMPQLRFDNSVCDTIWEDMKYNNQQEIKEKYTQLNIKDGKNV